MKKNILIIILLVLVLVFGVYFWHQKYLVGLVSETTKTEATQQVISNPILYSVSSPDNTFQAVTYLSNAKKVKKFTFLNEDRAGAYGDTVVLWNLKTGEHILAWQDTQDTYIKVNKLNFSPDGKKLFIITDTIIAYDLATKVATPITDSYGWCGIEINAIAPDDTSLIYATYCYEAGEEILTSTIENKILWKIGQYGDGGSDTLYARGYARPGVVIATDTQDDSYPPTKTDVLAYTPDGKVMKTITSFAGEMNTFDAEWDGRRNDATLVITVKDSPTIFIDRQTLKTLPDFK